MKAQNVKAACALYNKLSLEEKRVFIDLMFYGDAEQTAPEVAKDQSGQILVYTGIYEYRDGTFHVECEDLEGLDEKPSKQGALSPDGETLPGFCLLVPERVSGRSSLETWFWNGNRVSGYASGFLGLHLGGRESSSLASGIVAREVSAEVRGNRKEKNERFSVCQDECTCVSAQVAWWAEA